MWQITRSSFHYQIRCTLLQSWSAAAAATNKPAAPQNLLPQTHATFSEGLPAPKITGLLFALLHKIALALPIQLLQGPSSEEQDVHALDVANFILEYCVATGLKLLTPAAIDELNNLVVEILQTLYYDEDQDALELEQKRVQLLTCALGERDRLQSMEEYTWDVTMIYLRALVESHMPLFRQRWTQVQFEECIAGFETGLACGVAVVVRFLPSPMLEPIDWDQYYLEDDDEDDADGGELDIPDDEYVPTGPRVPHDAFCQPVDSSSVPPDSSCTICSEEVTTVAIGDEAVVTVCQHYFHAECLGSWVNDSAVSSSNTCPDCRKEMCEARSRVPVDDCEGDDENQDGDDGEGEVEDELLKYIRQLRGDAVQTQGVRELKSLPTLLSEVEDFL